MATTYYLNIDGWQMKLQPIMGPPKMKLTNPIRIDGTIVYI